MGTIVLRSQESHKLRHHPQATQGLWGQGRLVVRFFGGWEGGKSLERGSGHGDGAIKLDGKNGSGVRGSLREALREWI